MTTVHGTGTPLAQHVQGLALRCLCVSNSSETIHTSVMKAYPGLANPVGRARSVPYRRVVFGLFQDAVAADGRPMCTLLFAFVVKVSALPDPPPVIHNTDVLLVPYSNHLYGHLCPC